MLKAKLKKIGFAVCLLTMALWLSACRQDMHDNPRYEANEDGANRQLPEGAVARGSLDLNPSAPKVSQVNATPGAGGAAGATVPAAVTGEDGFPFKITKDILDRGESRFNISCLPCHGKLGDGNGMIVQRGFRRPPSYHDPRLKAAPSSYFYDVMTNGFGAMSSYSDQLTPEDRWKVAAYIRALQLSQHANIAELNEQQKKEFDNAVKAKPENKGGHGAEAKPVSAPAQPGGHD
ncbi:MAG: c-type cytochrome [Blastocatellia bacterium]